MSKFPDIATGFKLLRELDLNKIREHAEADFQLIVIGDAGVGKSTLISQLRSNQNPIAVSDEPLIQEYRLDEEILFEPRSTVILVLDGTQPDHIVEKRVFEKLLALKIPMIVCFNKCDLMTNQQVTSGGRYQWHGVKPVFISAIDRQSVIKELVPTIVHTCKGWEVPLARRLMLFREFVSRQLIDNTCLVNATYSLGTGLAEIVPLLSLPLNAADMVILTKNQAFMAYQVSLAMGLPADWRQTMPKLAAVVGSGFLWRQIARQLVGLVPGLGIVFKVSVSYAGTYAVGQAIYQWCNHGEKLSPKALKSLYREAMERGKEVAQSLIQKRQNLRLRDSVISDNKSSFNATCPSCRKETMEGALYCAFCGKPLPL